MSEVMRSAVTSSETFKHDDACPLFSARHAVSEEIADVLHALDEMDGVTVSAGGCSTCATHALTDAPEVDAYVSYVAQRSGSHDRLYVGYDSEPTAYTVIGACVDHGVAWSWDGSTAHKVCIGDSTAYDD